MRPEGRSPRYARSLGVVRREYALLRGLVLRFRQHSGATQPVVLAHLVAQVIGAPRPAGVAGGPEMRVEQRSAPAEGAK